MRITFIGSGNVATHLALAMHQRGHQIDQIWSRNIQHAQYLAERVEAQPINDFSQLHTSGATPIKILKKTSTHYGVLWSPQSFVRDVALDYNELPFCIEGCDKETEQFIEEFIGMISPHIYHTTHNQRQYLHLASVYVNNFTNGLYAVAQQLCAKHKVPFEILHPIITTTAKRVQWGDVRYQLTGPAVRGDEKTLNAHRKLLTNDPQALALYDSFTELLQQLKK